MDKINAYSQVANNYYQNNDRIKKTKDEKYRESQVKNSGNVEESTEDYICDNCGYVFDEPKYTLMIPTTIEDDTGAIQATFFDNLAEELIGMNKEEVIALLDDGYGIEDKIEDLVGYTIEIIANVSFDEYNETNRLNPKKILKKYM